jgi:Carboxypeptidase regulatory-like domain/TonB dependent receptor/TonB-dependent Receptor Plug Domain
MPGTRYIFRIVIFFALLCFTGGRANGQFKASLQGTVVDPEGSAVTNATVSIVEQSTGAHRSTVTSDQGYYRISELPPGRYKVTVQVAGFKESVTENVAVQAEEPRGLDITLEIGAVNEQVVVSGSSESLHTENANTGTTISTDEITRLPQNGRDPYELLRLTPGIFGDGSRGGNGGANNLPNSTGPGGSNQSIFQTENAVQISANGQRSDQNNFTIDGVSVNSLQYGGAAVITPNQDSVQEMTVLSSTYSAEDGRNSGAQVKVVTKGGTNSVHGAGFFKYQDPNWNAFNKYGGPDNAPNVRDDNNYRQFGGSVGGPILRDKFFFFFSYEGVRSNNPTVSAPTWVETPEFRNLVTTDRPGSIAAQIFASQGIAPRIAQVLTPTCELAGITVCNVGAGSNGPGLDIGSPAGAQGQYVSINQPQGGGLDGISDIQYVTLNVPNAFSGNQFNGRFDHIAGKNVFSYSGYFTRFDNVTADSPGRSRPQGDINLQPFSQVNSVSFIHTFSPTMVNEARANFTRFAYNQITSDSNINFGIPRIEIEGYNFDRIRFGAPQGATTPAAFAENTFDFRDTVTVNHRTHTMRMGLDISPEQNNNNLSGAARPLYVAHNIWNLVNDTPIFEAIDVNPQTGGPADAQRYLRSKDFGFFFQDDWKVRPNFTLNLGLRYDYFQPFTDAKDHLSNITIPNNVLANASVGSAQKLIHATKRDFGPRVGFSWAPARFKDGNTVVRGGGGVLFNRPDDVLFGNAAFNPPNYARASLCCGTSTADFGTPFANGQILYALGATTAYNSYPANPALAYGIDPITGGLCGNAACAPDSDIAVEIYGGSPNYRDAYVYVYSLEVERRLPWGFIGTVGYQGSDSHKLTRLVNQNFLQAPSPSFFAVYIPTSDVNANYNALNTRLRRPFANGLTLDFQYRYSKSIDQLSNEGPGSSTNQTAPAQPQTEHGPSDFDAKHTISLFALYDLPIFKDHSTFLGKVLGGWQVNGLMSWHTGFPWTPVTGQINSVPITSAATINPTRPSGVLMHYGFDTSNSALTAGTNFAGLIHQGDQVPDPANPGATISAQCGNPDPTTRPGYPFFDICTTGLPALGRNSLRGPGYFDLDMSVVKRFGLPNTKFWGEGAAIELRGNFFNIVNKLNLQPFSFGTDNTRVENSLFGISPGALSGRVIEFQARFSF